MTAYLLLLMALWRGKEEEERGRSEEEGR